MESSNVMAIKCGLIVCLFLSSLSIAHSFFDDKTQVEICFKSCLNVCLYDKKSIRFLCPLKCTKICVADPWTKNFQALLTKKDSSCELDCATSKCTNSISTNDIIGLKFTLLHFLTFFFCYTLFANKFLI